MEKVSTCFRCDERKGGEYKTETTGANKRALYRIQIKVRMNCERLKRPMSGFVLFFFSFFDIAIHFSANLSAIR